VNYLTWEVWNTVQQKRVVQPRFGNLWINYRLCEWRARIAFAHNKLGICAPWINTDCVQPQEPAAWWMHGKGPSRFAASLKLPTKNGSLLKPRAALWFSTAIACKMRLSKNLYLSCISWIFLYIRRILCFLCNIMPNVRIFPFKRTRISPQFKVIIFYNNNLFSITHCTIKG
jgi:hypothetical protein